MYTDYTFASAGGAYTVAYVAVSPSRLCRLTFRPPNSLTCVLQHPRRRCHALDSASSKGNCGKLNEWQWNCGTGSALHFRAVYGKNLGLRSLYHLKEASGRMGLWSATPTDLMISNGKGHLTNTPHVPAPFKHYWKEIRRPIGGSLLPCSACEPLIHPCHARMELLNGHP